MTNFDEFFESFLQMVFTHFDLIQEDREIFNIILDAPIKGLDEREFYIRCWLAQKKVYFGW